MTASEGSTLRERAPSPPCAPNGYPAVAHKREGSYARHSFAEEDAGSEEAAGRALAAALERLLREGESNDGAGADKDKSPGIDDDDQDLDSKGADDGPGGVDEVIEQHVGALGRGQLCHALIASLAMVPQVGLGCGGLTLECSKVGDCTLQQGRRHELEGNSAVGGAVLGAQRRPISAGRDQHTRVGGQ